MSPKMASSPRLNMVVAVCNNMGIGLNGTLPWPRLRKDMEFFKKITSETKNPDKKNAVILGRKTYFSIPEKHRPLPKRINIILSREMTEAPQGAYIARSLDDAVSMTTATGKLADEVESIHVIGGSTIYKVAMESNFSCRMYVTRVLADFECDTFLADIDSNKFQKIDNCDGVPSGRVTDGNIDLEFEVYEKETTPEVRMLMFDVMVAICDNRGIAFKNGLPWPPLSKDFKYYTALTSHVNDKAKKCVNIKGKQTWLSTGDLERRRDNVMNIIVSKHPGDIKDDPYVHKIVGSFNEALQYASSPEVRDQIEHVWIMGGQRIYQEAILHPCCRRIHLTRIYGQFEYDRTFPEFGSHFKEIRLPNVEQEMHIEDGIRYQYKVFEKSS